MVMVQVVAAVCNLVSMSVLRIPNAVLQDKSSPALKIFQHVAILHASKVKFCNGDCPGLFCKL